MINLNKYITEKLKISASTRIIKIEPETLGDLTEIIDRRYRKLLKENNEVCLDLNDINVSNIKHFSYIFEHMPKLISVDMESWNMSQAEDIHGLFWNNRSIREIYCSSWDTHNIHTMYGVFYYCENLEKLDISKWDVSNVEEFNLMFENCKKLSSQTFDLSEWDPKTALKRMEADPFYAMFRNTNIKVPQKFII